MKPYWLLPETRIWTASAVALLLAFVSGFLGSVAVSRGRAEAYRYTHSLEIGEASMAVRAKIREAAAVGRGALLIDQRIDGDRAVMLADEIHLLFQRLVELTRDSAVQQSRLAGLHPLIKLQINLFHAVQQKAREGKKEEAVRIIRFESIPLNVRIDGLLDTFDADERQLLTMRSEAAQTSNNVAQVLIWVSLICSLAFILGSSAYAHVQVLHGRRCVQEHDEVLRIYELVTNAHPCAYVAIDAGSLVISWNPAAVVQFGYTRDEAMGQNLAELIIPPEHRLAHSEGILHYERTGEGPILDRLLRWPVLLKDGTRRELEMVITAIRFGDRHFFAAFIHTDWPSTMKAAAHTDVEGKDANPTPVDD